MNFKEAYPHLMKYWDFKKNKKQPEDVHYGSRIQKVYFKCENNHSFEKTPSLFKRLKNKSLNCPICLKIKKSKLKLFKYLAPKYAECWDFKKNKVNLNQILENYREYCYFRCKKGHLIKRKPFNLVKSKSKKITCGICSGVKVIEETKLENVNPEIASEYCRKRNNTSISTIPFNSNKIYWWKCQNNHYWKSSVSSRTGSKYKNKKPTKCPYCWSNSVSRNELIIYTELYQFFNEVESNKKIERKKIDVFIKDLNLAIEYDGSKWHKDIAKDIKKNEILKKYKINTLRIRENPLEKISREDYVYKLEDSLFEAIKYILKYILNNYEIDINKKNKIKKYLKKRKIEN